MPGAQTVYAADDGALCEKRTRLHARWVGNPPYPEASGASLNSSLDQLQFKLKRSKVTTKAAKSVKEDEEDPLQIFASFAPFGVTSLLSF